MRRLTAPLLAGLFACWAAPSLARADEPQQPQPPAATTTTTATSVTPPSSQAPSAGNPASGTTSAPEPSAPSTSSVSASAPSATEARRASEHRRRPAEPARRGAHARTPRRPASLSMGHPNSGRLQNGARLEEDETIRYVPGRPLHYGTDELVGLVRRAARTVYRRHHVRLAVGDLSSAGGGPVGHHASHQSGRDADLSFYVVNRRGESVALTDYVSFWGNGTPMAGGALRFDTPRNWALVEALVDDPVVRVEHIFVARGLRALLLAYARAVGAQPGAIARAEAVMHQPVHGSPHANHFHVRIACPAGDGACIEQVRLPPRPRRRRGPTRVAAGTRPAHRPAR